MPTTSATFGPRPRLMDRYRRFLPITDATPSLTLGEGATPLVHAEHLGAALGLRNLYLKVEGQNPTGSFKDRGMVLAVAKAAEAGATAIVCASTGNTSASAAAYGAAAGMEVIVVLPKGQIAVGKLLQALVAGARVVAIDGNFDQALAIVRALAEQDDHPVTLVNSVNPFRLEGQKTAAFEICDDLGRAPDILAIPVGNAGNISAYWAGFSEYRAAGLASSTPAMWGFQAAGAAPIVVGHRIERPETIATAIRIGDPGLVDEGRRRARRLGRADHGRHRRRDPRRLSRRGPLPGRVLRAGLGGEPGRDHEGRRRRRGRSGRRRRLRAHGARTQGPDDGRAAGATIPGSRRIRRGCRRRTRLVREDALVAHWLAELDGRRVSVEVPASAANLGAGYDCLGLALALTNKVEVEVRGWSRGEIELTVDGEGQDELTEDRDNRFVRGVEAALRAARGELPDGVGWRIEMHNQIPLARGLGSSAAATVGGLLAGNALLGDPLSNAELLRLATDIEGHPDNAAAVLLGGFVVSAATADGVEAIRFDAPRDLRAVLFIPDLRLPTGEMRDVLPVTVPFGDAAANLAAVAIGVAGLAKGRFDLLGRLTVDRLHEPYRAAIFPALPQLVEAARGAGALGACLSGAGSAVLAFADSLTAISRIEGAFAAAAADTDLTGRVLVVAPRNAGAKVKPKS